MQAVSTRLNARFTKVNEDVSCADVRAVSDDICLNYVAFCAHEQTKIFVAIHCASGSVCNPGPYIFGKIKSHWNFPAFVSSLGIAIRIPPQKTVFLIDPKRCFTNIFLFFKLYLHYNFMTSNGQRHQTGLLNARLHSDLSVVSFLTSNLSIVGSARK